MKKKFMKKTTKIRGDIKRNLNTNKKKNNWREEKIGKQFISK